MLSNRHDVWQAYCATYRELLAQTGLPTAVTDAEHRFRDLLEAGEVVVSQTRFSLGDLTPAEWAAFYQFAAVFFREFESFAPEDRFPAFRRETERRGDKFPR